jgi:hypothetical protein
MEGVGIVAAYEHRIHIGTPQAELLETVWEPARAGRPQAGQQTQGDGRQDAGQPEAMAQPGEVAAGLGEVQTRGQSRCPPDLGRRPTITQAQHAAHTVADQVELGRPSRVQHVRNGSREVVA